MALQRPTKTDHMLSIEEKQSNTDFSNKKKAHTCLFVLIKFCPAEKLKKNF